MSNAIEVSGLPETSLKARPEDELISQIRVGPVSGVLHKKFNDQCGIKFVFLLSIPIIREHVTQRRITQQRIVVLILYTNC